MSSDDLDVTFLRKLILLNSLPEVYLSEFKGDNYKLVQKLTGYNKYKELNRLKMEYLKNNYAKDPFIQVLVKYLENPTKVKPSNVTFISMYQTQFGTFANRISEIYSWIRNVIHNAKFVDGDDIPIEYEVLKKPEYDICITYLMSFYSFQSVIASST